MNRGDNERCCSALFNLGDNCSILGKIARRLFHPPHPPPPAPRLTPTPPYPLIPKETGPSLSARTPHPEGPYQGKLDQGGAFVLQHSANRKKIQIISGAGAI